jgi:hypothetical protein
MPVTMRHILRPTAAAAALFLALAPAAAAQQLSGSARGAGMADAYGALARGAAAARYNPANLGLPGNPGFGIQLPTAVVHAGTGPIGLGDLAEWGGEVVPDSVKREWLARIPEGGALHADVGADVHAFGVSAGPFALSVGTVARSTVMLPREAVELVLFGNADESGDPRDVAMTGGRADGFVASVAALSFGRRIASWGTGDDGAPRHALAAGVSVKYVVGNALLSLRDARGSIGGDPLAGALSLPTVLVRMREDGWTRSNGWGFDVGLAYQGPRLALGVAVTDASNDFRWSLEDARVVDGRAAFTTDSSSSEFEERALDDPTVGDSLRAASEAIVGAAVFQPTVRASAAYRVGGSLSLTADLLHRFAGDGELQGEGGTSVGVGAELRPLGGLLPLRGGVRMVEGGTAWTVGTGLDFGAASLNVAYGRAAAEHDASTVAIGMSIGAGR